MDDIDDIRENVLDCLRKVITYCEENKVAFSRDTYRTVAKELDLDYTSDSAARSIFGSWDTAIKAAVSTLPDGEIKDEPNEAESGFSYLKRKWVGTKQYKILVLPDIHVPFQCTKAINTAIKVGASFEPDEVIQLGDLLDCFKVSRFVKDPDRGKKLQEEIEEGHTLLDTIKKAVGAKKATLLTGNHEERIRKYLESSAPALAHMSALKVDKLLSLKDIGWDFIPEHYFYAVNNVFFTHGEFISSHTAEKHMGIYDETIIHGHTHKISCSMRKYMNRTIEGWEMGCLSSLSVSQDYMKMANWQHCVGTIVTQGNDYWIQAHHIRDGRVNFNGKIIEG